MPKVILSILSSLLFVLGLDNIKLFNSNEKDIQVYSPVHVSPCNEQVYVLGLRTDTLRIQFATTKNKEKLKDILKANKYSLKSTDRIINQTRIYFNPQKIAEGTRYLRFVNAADETVYLAYKTNPGKYLIIPNSDNAEVRMDSVPVAIETRKVCGIIDGSLDKTLDYLDIPKSIKSQLGNIYATAFDFYKLREGDTIRIIYEERFEPFEPPTPLQIKACAVLQKKDAYYAIGYRYQQDTTLQYFDAEAQNLKRCFLEMPLQFGRVASKYNLKRLHPVLNEVKAHLGTDYAAPYNTPILATASGVVVEAGYKQYNGNYVKIKHDNTFTTQYLHMCRIGKNIKTGKQVKQGDVIGFVGATGLATGPHVCYRFWKNGKQVDPYRENLKFVKPTDSTFVKMYLQYFNTVKDELSSIVPLSPELSAMIESKKSKTTK
jgi:murein DD-endopeptidase MepM/ murein hydrolase activator NlpD